MPKKNVANTNSDPKSSNMMDLNQTLENFLIQAKKYLIPAASLILILVLALIVFAFFVNKKKEKVAGAYAEFYEALKKGEKEKDGGVENEKSIQLKNEALDSVIDSYPETAAAMEAKFQKAKAEFELGNYGEATKRFSDFYQQHFDQGPISELARMGEATCFLAREEFENAKQRFSDLAKDVNKQGIKNQFPAQAKYQVAFCDFLLENYDQSKSGLTALLTDTKDEKIKEKAQSFLAKLTILSPQDFRNALLNRVELDTTEGIESGGTSSAPKITPSGVAEELDEKAILKKEKLDIPEGSESAGTSSAPSSPLKPIASAVGQEKIDNENPEVSVPPIEKDQ